MTTKNMTDDQRLFLHERGPVSELELVEWELDGLTAQERMSLERRRLFLRAFALRGIVLEGCKAAGVSRDAVYHWRETSEWFETLYQIAIEEAALVVGHALGCHGDLLGRWFAECPRWCRARRRE